MNKKEISKLENAKAKWDDTITEKDVVEKLQIDEVTLRKYRREGRIKNFRYLSPATKENSKIKGKKVVYSLIELTELFCATV